MAKIVTLTINPALDLSTSVERVVPSAKLRCAPYRRDAGGGGVNVARVVKRFGGDVEAIVTIGGFTGHLLRSLIEKEGIAARYIEVDAETREDFSVNERASSKQYRFVLPGAPLDEIEWKECLSALAATKPDIVVASGSLPPGVPEDFYAQAAAAARKAGAKFFLDTSGPPLKAAIDVGVDLIKPNLREMCELVSGKLADDPACIGAARKLIDTGKAKIVAVSLGHLGALIVTNDAVLRAQPLPVKIVSSVGAGDSFLGALAFSLAKGEPVADAFRLAVAAGSAALIHEGTELARPDDAMRLMPQVVIAPV